MKVRFIDDDYSKVEGQKFKNILLVGDDALLPKLGEVYEVVGYANIEGVNYYELAGLESPENYEISVIVFNVDRFEIVDETFVPNHIEEDGSLVRKSTFYVNFELDKP